MSSKLLTDVAPLRNNPQFRRWWAGSLVSSIGSVLTAFAVTLQVYDITRSPFAVGAIGLAQMVPTLVIGLFGGSLADAVDRRKLVLVTSSSIATLSVALAVQAFAGLSQVWLLYALVFLRAAVRAIDQPASRTFIPRLLPADQLAAGIALNRVSFQLSIIAGPSLAGVITAAAGGHLQACYLIDAVSFGAVLYAVARLPAMPAQPGNARPGLRAVGEGIGFLRRSQPLAGAFLADLNATVFAFPVALFPAINAERFGGSPATLGLLTTAIGVGGLVSSVFTGPIRHISRHGAAMLCTVAICGAAFAGFALARSLWLGLVFLAVAAAADTFTVVFRSTIVQSVTTEALRGRLTATEYVVGASGDSLGNLESGALGSLTTPTISAFAGGIITVVLSGVMGLALPGFAKYRQARSSTAAAPAEAPA